ncbi:MAG TPA: FprA family A-type flavoprotein [Prolixibacteraceae bacterium]|nr:FprA family A-type flavoprotein [Prolixibacteraceae bacterium]
MHPIPLTDDVYFLGMNDRRTALFENLWPLPYGVSYNAALIVDHKVCLIDTVERAFGGELLNRLLALLGDRPVDYLVVNHVEPDHSGSIRSLLDRYPGLTLVGNKKTFPMIENFYGSLPNTRIISDGDTLELGRHRLVFQTIPMVHWPESMVSYEVTEQILFSNDAFGSFGALDGGVFDDEVDPAFWEGETLRYYANIVGKYGPHTQRALAKLNGLPLRMIVPSHGRIWRSRIPHILERYQKWSRYETDPGVVIVFGTMYGHTEEIADAIARQLAVRGIQNIRIHDASKSHLSYILADLFRFRGLIIGSCAYNNELFPTIEAVVREIEHKGIRDHLLGLFGSYSWNGGGVKNLEKFSTAIGWEQVHPPVEAKGALSKESHRDAVALANAMADRLLYNE